MPTTQTKFLNVDLEVASKSDLQPLADALAPRAFALHLGRVKRTYRANFEIAKSTTSADRTIRAFCDLIEKLPKGAKQIWKNAQVRDFNIGIEAGQGPHSVEFPIAAPTVARVAKLDARIVVTVYAPVPEDSEAPA